MREPERNPVFYDELRCDLQNADVLLFRAGGLIPVEGRGEHSHAALAVWWSDDLMCVEFRWVGARAVTLSSQVRRFSGLIDVYRPRNITPHTGEAIGGAARRQCGVRYSFGGILRQLAIHYGFVRAGLVDDEKYPRQNWSPKFCSWGDSYAIRVGAAECGYELDVVPHLADHDTTPADLARSASLDYVYTLVWRDFLNAPAPQLPPDGHQFTPVV